MKMKFIIGLVVILSLTACNSATPSPTAQVEPPPDTATSPPIPSATATPLPSLTPTITPTPIATHSYFVRDGTPVPQPAEAISAENVCQIAELARWGDGQFEQSFTVNEEMSLVQTTLGVTAFDPDSQEVFWRFEPPAGADSIDLDMSKSVVAVGDYAGTIWMVNIVSGKVLYSWEAHSSSVSALAFSQTKPLLASGSDDETIAVWSIPDHSLEYRLSDPESRVDNLEAIDGRLLYWDRGSTVLWRLDDGELLFNDDSPVLSIFPDAGLFATNKPLALREIQTGELLQSFSAAIGPGNQILSATSVALSPDQTKLAIGYFFQIRTDVWDLTLGEKVFQLVSPSNDKPPSRSFGDGGGPYYVSHLEFSIDGNYLTVVSGHPDVDYWDMQTGQLIRNESEITASRRIPVASRHAQKLFFSPDSEWLASESFVWHIHNDIATPVSQGLGLFAFSSDSHTVFAYENGQEQLIRVLQIDTLENARNIFLPIPDGTVCYFCGFSPFADRAIAPDGSLYVEADFEGGYRLWDLENNSWISPLDFEIILPRSLSFSSDGEWLLAVAANASEIRVMDKETREVVYWLSAQPPLFYEADISLDSKMIVAPATDHVVIWELNEARPSAYYLMPQEGSSSITTAAISLNGDLVAAGVRGGEIIIWRVSDREILRIIPAHFSTIYDLTFSPDGHYLASSSRDGTVRLWGIPPN